MAAKKDLDIIENVTKRLKRGEVSYSSLSRKLKKEFSIIENSNFDEIIQHAPKGYWRNKNFIKAVLKNLDYESKIEFKKEHYEKLLKIIKKYNAPESRIMTIVTINLSAHPYSEILSDLI